MESHLFYEAGCERRGGLRRLVVLPRRCLRRVLRPMLYRLAEVLLDLGARLDRLELRHAQEREEGLVARARLEQTTSHLLEKVGEIDRRLDRLDEQFQAIASSKWDQGAMIWRLGTLEDQVEALLAERAATSVDSR